MQSKQSQFTKPLALVISYTYIYICTYRWRRELLLLLHQVLDNLLAEQVRMRMTLVVHVVIAAGSIGGGRCRVGGHCSGLMLQRLLHCNQLVQTSYPDAATSGAAVRGGDAATGSRGGS